MVSFRMVKTAQDLFWKLESAYGHLLRNGADAADLARLLRALRAAKRRYIRRVERWDAYINSL